MTPRDAEPTGITPVPGPFVLQVLGWFLHGVRRLLAADMAIRRLAGLLDDDVELPSANPDAEGAAAQRTAAVSPVHKRRRILRLRELEQQGSPSGKAG